MAALLILCAAAAGIIGGTAGRPGMAQVIRAGIYTGLIAAWGVSLQRRIIQAQTRRYLIVVALLMLFWLAARTVKHGLAGSPNAARLLWYSYYIPMLLIPTLVVFMAMSIGRPEGYRLPLSTKLLYIPTLAIMLLVLTNDLHQMAFSFPPGIPPTDREYGYGWVYWAALCWIELCTLCTLVIMACKCRIPGTGRRLWQPVLPIAASLVYSALYVSGAEWLRLVAGDMTVFQCLMIMAAVEGCIQCGLIQSNEGYDLLFEVTTINAQITDRRLRLKRISSSAAPLSRKSMEAALEGAVQLNRNTLLKGQEISSGYVFWQEDISELQSVLDELQTVQDELRDTGDVLKAEAEQCSYYLRITEENRLYDMVEQQTAGQAALLRELLFRLRTTEDTEEARRLLGRIVVTGTYVKRRSNLIFTERQAEALEAAELRLCLGESAAALRLCNIKCSAAADIKGQLPAAACNAIYDFFEAAVERSLPSLSSLLFCAEEGEDEVTARAALCCDEDMTPLRRDFSGAKTERDEDGIWYITLCIPKEGGEWIR